MSNNYYSLYEESTIELAETLVIKSELSASDLNTYVQTVLGSSSVDTSNPYSWKYYLNICGLYHPCDEYELENLIGHNRIQVTSLDTLEVIDFTQENLALHTATALAYQFGTRNYRELVGTYPQYKKLILGILYPASLDIAVASQEGTILSYKSDLVESNEVSLINDIQDWIYRYNQRWTNVQFNLTDSWYETTRLGIMYAMLVPEILRIREKYSNTNEAHSFHLQQYLASHDGLDVYLPYMTKEQAMFFYRNIRYLQRNNGKTETFHTLAQKVMALRYLPLGNFKMLQTDVDMDTNYVPTLNFHKTPIVPEVNALEEYDFTLTQILGKESSLNTGNPDYIDQESSFIKRKFEISNNAKLPLKMLESSAIDYTDATPYTLSSILLNHWIDWSSSNFYNSHCTITDPATGDVISLSSQQAFIYFLYIQAKAIGTTLTTVPVIGASRLARRPIPSTSDLLSVCDTSYVSLSEANDVRLTMPTLTSTISTSAFYTQCQALYNAAQTQLGMVALVEHQYKRGLYKNMVDRLYCDRTCTFSASGVAYSDWLNAMHLPTDFTQDQYDEMLVALFKAATGSNLDTTLTIQNIQKAMVGIMQQLSSYSVQFIREINENPIKVLNQAVIRAGDDFGLSKEDIAIRNLIVDATNNTGYSANQYQFDIYRESNPIVVKSSRQYQSESVNSIIYPAMDGAPVSQYSYRLKLPNLIQSVRPEGVEESDSTWSWMSSFNSIDDSLKATIKDVYKDCFPVAPKVGMSLEDLITFNTTNKAHYLGVGDNMVNGFHYLSLSNTTQYFTNMKFNYTAPFYKTTVITLKTTGFKSIYDRVRTNAFLMNATTTNTNSVLFQMFYGGAKFDVFTLPTSS